VDSQLCCIKTDLNCVFPTRHVIKVSSDHRATVLFQTSKSDVNIKLNILDHEKEVASSQGKGHVTLPVYCFLANNGLYTHTHTHIRTHIRTMGSVRLIVRF